MKKIGIVTIVSLNFGNRLQNYALQTVLKSIGCEVRTMCRNKPEKGIKCFGRRVAQMLLQTKGAKFRKFDKYIQFSDEVIERDNYPDKLDERYDFFVAGSDQIWNP